MYIDNSKRLELFNIINSLNTHELLQYSLINKISLNQCNDNDDNLIHIVIRLNTPGITEQSKLNVIKFLVQNEVNPDKPNKNNNTPLHLACEMQYLKITDYLLKLGVNVNFRDNMENSAFHYLLTGDIKLQDKQNKISSFIPLNNDRDFKIDLNSDLTKLKSDQINPNDIYMLDIVSYIPHTENFIIYMNDFTNNALLIKKYKIDINKDIIKSLLRYGANPYSQNISGQTPIYNILKNYNYKIIEELKKNNVDFSKFSEEPKHFIETEISNTNYKLFNNETNLNKLLSNITETQYNEFRLLILNNSQFGNNILKNFEKSFNIIAYETLLLLSTYVTRENKDEIKNKKSNLTPLSINLTNKELIISDIDNAIDTEIINSEDDEIRFNLTTKKKDINKINPNAGNVIKNNNYYINTVYKYIETFDISKNYSNKLILLYSNNDLEILKSIANYCEKYFIRDKFLESNKQLKNVYSKILEKYTKNIICDSIITIIEIIIDKIKLEDNNIQYKFIRKKLSIYQLLPPPPNNIYFNEYIYDKSTSLIENILLIFKNRDYMNQYNNMDVKDILTSIVDTFRNILNDVTYYIFTDSVNNNNLNPNLPLHKTFVDKFINILQIEVVNYFDLLIPKLMLSWNVIIENIFKYYINLNRMVQCKTLLN